MVQTSGKSAVFYRYWPGPRQDVPKSESDSVFLPCALRTGSVNLSQTMTTPSKDGTFFSRSPTMPRLLRYSLCMTYANALRCIGQELESREIEVFELKTHANEYRLQAGDPDPPSLRLIEIKLSAQQIELLDRRGQSRRGKANEEMRFDTIPNMLRAVGEYVDKHGYLRRVDNSCPPIADQVAFEVEYQTRAGDIRLETLPMNVIREASISMYKRRAQRPNISSILARKRQP